MIPKHFIEAIEAVQTAAEAWRDVPHTDIRAKRVACKVYIDARDDVRQHFAMLSGWRVARTSFSLDQLQTRRHCRNKRFEPFNHHPLDTYYFDHAEYFREPDRPWRPAAIVTHTYAPVEECGAAIRAAGFDAEVLPACWYSQMTTAIVITRGGLV